MVGFDPRRKRELTKLDYAFSGSFAGFVTRFLCQPLDVVKIRLQLQIEPIRSIPGSKYHSLFHTVVTIFKEEGVSALWKGHVPAQGLSILFGLVQFSSFEYLTKTVWNYLPSTLTIDWKPVTHFVIGGASGCLATVAAQPFDVIRTRLVGQGEPKMYRGMTHAARSMFLQEGPRVFYKGLVPSLIQIAPHTGLQFGFYTFAVEIWDFLTREDSPDVGSMESFICGSVAGTCSKTVIYPFDVIKKRLQIQGFEEVRRSFGQVRHYQGVLHCGWTLAREEGMRGLYKGYIPSMIKAAVTTGLHFGVYEQTCQFLQRL